jgi:AcrR family transcriptional regulator
VADSPASERRRRTEPDGRGTLRDEQRRLTRRRLAEAARELFEEVGYAAVTADGIARRAGANRATFYLHYASKADVVLELMDAMHDDVIAVVAQAGALEEPTREDVRGWLADVVAFFEANRALVDAHHQAMPVEPLVAQRWWRGCEQMADAMPRVWESQADRIRLIAARAAARRADRRVASAAAPGAGPRLRGARTDGGDQPRRCSGPYVLGQTPWRPGDRMPLGSRASLMVVTKRR